MSEESSVVEILSKTLSRAQRPLSVRRLVRLCREAGHTGGVWTNKGVELILRQSVEFLELRTGVFVTQSQLYRQRDSVISSAPSAVLPVFAEVENTPIFPESMTDVVALRERFGGRDALKRFLANKMTERLTQMEHTSTSRRSNVVESQLKQQPQVVVPAPEVEARTVDERFIERRKSSVIISEERRAGRTGYPELAGLPLQMKRVLEAADKTLSLEDLQTRLNRTAARTDKAKLKMAALVENERSRHQGYREQFVLDEANLIGLTSWGLPDRLIELELHMQRDRTEIEELVKRSLLNRLSDLSDNGFSEALMLMLERSGISEFQRHENEASELSIMTGRQSSDGVAHSVAVISQNSWTEMTEVSVEETLALLRRLNVETGILISMGTFTEEAIVASRTLGQISLQLIDGAILANLFYQARLGLRTMTWTCCYPDSAFFRNLSGE
jgi:restriction endonuclease Mrr